MTNTSKSKTSSELASAQQVEENALTPIADFAVKYGRRVINISVPFTKQIADLKSMLQAETNVPVQKQRVLFNAPVVKTRRRSDATDDLYVRDLFAPSLLTKLEQATRAHLSKCQRGSATTQPSTSNEEEVVVQHIAVTAMLIGSAEEAPLIDSNVTSEASRLVMTTVELDGRWYRCSYGRGYCRQTAYVCRTCVEEGRADPSHALCLACSEICHAGHDVEEWGVRYHMRCDCCTMKCWKHVSECESNNTHCNNNNNNSCKICDNEQSNTANNPLENNCANSNTNNVQVKVEEEKDAKNTHKVHNMSEGMAGQTASSSTNNKELSVNTASHSEHTSSVAQQLSSSTRSSASMQLERMSNVQTSDVRRRMQRKRSRSTSPLLVKRLANATSATSCTNTTTAATNIDNVNKEKGGSDAHTASESSVEEQDQEMQRGNKTSPLSINNYTSSHTPGITGLLAFMYDLQEGELCEADSIFPSSPQSESVTAAMNDDSASHFANEQQLTEEQKISKATEEQEMKQEVKQEHPSYPLTSSTTNVQDTTVNITNDINDSNNNEEAKRNNEQGVHEASGNNSVSMYTLDKYNNMYNVMPASRGKVVTRCLFVVDSDTNQPPTSALLPCNHRNTYPRQAHSWCYCKDDHPSDDPECGGICCMLCTSCYWSLHITRLFTDCFRRVPCYGDVVYGETIAFKCHTCNCYVCPACRYRCHRDHECDDTPIIPSAHDGNDYGAPAGVIFSCGCHGMCSIATNVPSEEVDDSNTYTPLPNAVGLEMMISDVFSGFICAYCMQEYPWLMYNDPRTCYHGHLPAKLSDSQLLPIVACGDSEFNKELPSNVFPFHGMLYPVTAFTEEMTCKCADCRAAYEEFAPRAEQEATEMIVELHDECDNCHASIKDQNAYMCATCENEGKTFFICARCNDVRLRLITGISPEQNTSNNSTSNAPVTLLEQQPSSPSALPSSCNTAANMNDTTNDTHSTAVISNTSSTELSHQMEQSEPSQQQQQQQQQEIEQLSNANSSLHSITFDHNLNHVFLADTLDNLYAICGMQVMQSLDEETRDEVVENWDSSSQQHVITDTIVNTFGQVPIEFTPEEKKEFTAINSKVMNNSSNHRKVQHQHESQKQNDENKNANS